MICLFSRTNRVLVQNCFSLLTFLSGPSLSATSAKPEEKKTESPSFVASYLTALHENLPIQSPASTNLLNDLAEAMKALDGKNAEERGAREWI